MLPNEPIGRPSALCARAAHRWASLRAYPRQSLDAAVRTAHCCSVSAADIIREIGALPPEEQRKVIAFTKQLDSNRRRQRNVRHLA